MLLIWSSNYFWIAITKLCSYQLSLAFSWWTVHTFSFHEGVVYVLVLSVFFNSSLVRTGNIISQVIFLFSNPIFHTLSDLCLPLSFFIYNLSTSLFGCNAPQIHSLSTVVFLLHIWKQSLPLHLLLLFYSSHLVLIVRTIEVFVYIPLFFSFILFS